MDPYAVLGVNRGDSPEQIKKAYLRKARENHPDLNPGDPKAAERMNQVNEAYDRITNPQKYAASDARARAGAYGRGGSGAGPGGAPGGFGGYGWPGSGPGAGPYGWPGGFDFSDLFGYGRPRAAYVSFERPRPLASDSPAIKDVIAALGAGSFRQALSILNGIAAGGRDARWHYLSALANCGSGNQVMALEQIRRALQLDPGNATYQRVQSQLQRTGTAYREAGRSRGFNGNLSRTQMVCCGLCAAEMVVNMLLILPAGAGLPC
jgi:molecular chaperone DnaJ